MNWWLQERIWSTWIVSGRYITCISVFRSLDDVTAAVMDKLNELGPLIEGQPIVLVGVHALSNGNLETLRDLYDGAVSIILE